MRILGSLFFFFVVGCAVKSSSCDPIDTDFNVTVFTDEIVQWVTAGVKSSKLMRFINDLALPTALQREDWTTLEGIQAKSLCIICKSLTKTILNLRRLGTPVEAIHTTIAKLCTYLNLQTEEVCQGVVALNTPIILYIVDNDETINENDVCSLVLQDHACSKLTERYEWSIDIDQESVRFIDAQSSEKSLRILQITDIHYDPIYEPGGNADCKEPTCCRKGQKTASYNISAGFWGDYNYCDMPWHSIVDALDHIKHQQQNVDLIYFTGDIIDHGVWATSREGNIESLIKSFSKIKETFRDNAVYPILGNHEPHPLNIFAPESIQDDSLSTRWLYELMANLWIDAGWLPESTRETIVRGGFYTLSPRRGLRLIAINNNVCYIYNWWLIYEPRDPYGQLKWLADTLLDAENNQEFVHILAHVPSGASDCQHTWSREFRKIVNRFSHIIVAHFNGHTHNDEFNVFYHPDDTTRIINIAWNGGSITPYANLNPNYKIYEANAETFAIQEVETWIYNLTEANQTPNKSPRWYKLYSFTEEYNLEDLSATSLNQLILKMASSSSVLESYHRNFVKYADPALGKKYDEAYLKEYICRIVRSSSSDDRDCKYFQSLNRQ